MDKGKEYTIADDKGPQKLLIWEKQGVYVVGKYSDNAKDRQNIFGKASNVIQSKNGEYLVIASEKNVLVYSLKENKPLQELHFNYIRSITLSPSEKYLQVLDKINVDEGKTLLFSFPDLKQTASFHEDQFTGYFNKEHFPLIRFSADDSHYFKYSAKHIDMFNCKNEKVLQIESGIVDFFQLSPISKGDEFFLTAIYLDKKTNEGKCDIFTHKSFKEPLYNKFIKKAQQVKIRFSPISNQFLMELQTYFDPTGKSYYGQFGIFIYNDEKNKISSIKTEKGPVHDFSWHPSGQKFIVISGFMPATINMFNKNNDKIFQFGKKHRNTIVWGNLGRFLCLAGFGSLNGQVQTWDIQTLKQIGFFKSSSASYCQWSPDDRKILTATVTPRLNVDNCYKVFSYTGNQLTKISYDHTELYGAHWVRLTNEIFEPRGLSPNRKIEVEKKEQGKFKSFAASLNFSNMAMNQIKQDKTPKLVPGQHPDDLKPKKKPRNKKKKQVQQLAPS